MVNAELHQRIYWEWWCGKCGREFGIGDEGKKKAEECCGDKLQEIMKEKLEKDKMEVS